MNLKPFNCTIRIFDPSNGATLGEYVLPVDSPDAEHSVASTLANAASFTIETEGGLAAKRVAFCRTKIHARNRYDDSDGRVSSRVLDASGYSAKAVGSARNRHILSSHITVECYPLRNDCPIHEITRVAMPLELRQTHQAAAGTIAGFVTGGLLSVAWLAMEKATGDTAEVVRLGRLSAQKAGRSARREAAPPVAEEQIMSHGGHLALSAAAGGLYGMVIPANAPPMLAGAGFGVVFYATAYGILAPLLGLRPALWNDARTNVAQRGIFHLLFGTLVGWLTPAIARRS